MANMLPILLIMRAEQNRRNRAARARREEEDRKRRLKRQEEERKCSYSRNVSSTRGYSSEEYLYKLVSEDESLVKFFDLVDEKTTEIMKREDEQDLLEIQDLLKESLTEIDKVKKVQEKLVKAGIKLDGSTFINGGSVGVETFAGHGFGGTGNYGYNPVEFPVVFNGIVVSKEAVQNLEENPYEKDYNCCRAATEDLGAEKARLEKEIARKELFLKLSPFGRDKARSELVSLKQCLHQVEYDISVGEKIKSKMDTFAALTPEQRDLIIEYYDAIDVYKPVGQNISQRITDNINRSHRYGKYRDRVQGVWEKAISELIAEGKLTEAEVTEVEDKLASFEIEDKRYDEGIKNNTLSNGRRDYASLVKYFYNRPMIEQKRKELAEKRAKKAELTSEEKVISEVEALAEALPNDKTKKPEDEQK